MSERSLQKQNIAWLDALRIAACLAVIALHVSSQGWHAAVPGSSEWRIFNAFNACVRWGVPVFVMISGSLFLDPQKPLAIRSVFGKYLLRIAATFCFWSLIYTAYAKWRAPGLTTLQMVNKFLQGQYHMWFLFLIAGLYVAAPLLRKFTESRETAKYFLTVAFLTVFVFSTAADLADFFLPRMGESTLSTLVTALRADWAKAYFFLPMGYTFYYVAGYYLRRWRPGRVLTAVILPLSAASFYVTAHMGSVLTSISGEATSFNSNFSLNVMFEALGIFVLFQKLGSKDGNGASRSGKVLKKLSQCSFGVYLVHVLFLDLLADVFGVHAADLPALVSVPVFTLGIAFASLLVSLFLNAIPGLRGRIV